jgi:hypothetical protein
LERAIFAILVLDHTAKVNPDEADHIIKGLAHRRQRPHEKISHAVVDRPMIALQPARWRASVKTATTLKAITQIAVVALRASCTRVKCLGIVTSGAST